MIVLKRDPEHAVRSGESIGRKRVDRRLELGRRQDPTVVAPDDISKVVTLDAVARFASRVLLPDGDRFRPLIVSPQSDPSVQVVASRT